MLRRRRHAGSQALITPVLAAAASLPSAIAIAVVLVAALLPFTAQAEMMSPAVRTTDATMHQTVHEALSETTNQTVQIRLEYLETTLTLTQREEFTDVRLPGCELLPRAGAPALPMCAEQIILPEGMRASGVQAVPTASVRIPCGTIRPAQPPAILGPIGVDLVPPAQLSPDPAVYDGSAIYPADLAVLRGTGRFGDLSIASCEVHPVQYDPATREIILHTQITLTLQLECDPNSRPACQRPREMTRIAREIAGQHLHGTENLPAAGEIGRAVRLDPDDYQYVIVTVEEQLGPYESYAVWKTAKGVPATVVTCEWIGGAYPGRDLAEKVRNFIIAAVAEWGTSYILLGGDEHIVPCRPCWAFDCEAGFYPDENDLYCDLYYSDLDGSWDDNGNDIFGEVEDNIDLYPDVMVGRAPTDDLSQANAAVNKFLTYERTAPSGRAMEAFFFAEILWSNPYTDSGIGKDMIADRHFGDPYEPIERQYESLGNESSTSVRNYLNWGPHLTNHAGHANYQVMGCGDGYLDRGDVDGLTNSPYYFVLFSIGCWAGAVDYGCIGEHFLVNGDGGTIAFVGNSRYGWGSPGNPGHGYSETFDSDFYGAILTEGLAQFGPAVAWPKIIRIPYSQDGNVYRWHQYQVNLFGDPEMICHTAEIRPMTLEAPTTIPLGSTQFTATVSDDNGPVVAARLCLAGADIYQVGFTDEAGQVTFAPVLPGAQTLTLTATAANHPYTDLTITAAGNDPFLTVAATMIDDDGAPPSAGNGDGEIGAGETIEFFVTVHNYGGQACSGVTGTLSETNPHVTIIADVASYGTVSSGGEATNATPFVFEVGHGCPADETIQFVLLLEDDALNSWTAQLPLTVVAPGPRFHCYSAVELIGNGNGIIEPGETAAVTVYVRNEGSGHMSPMTASLTTTDPNLVVIQGSASTDAGLPAGGIAALNPPFEVRVEDWCPPTTYGALDIAFWHDAGSAVDAFILAVGEPGFEDDMESGAGEWTHSGTNDMWHLTDYRQHSGSYSWYCGSAASHEYSNNMDAVLLSPSFVAPEHAELSFWCYFDVTIYGVDGLFIEIWQDDAWETLDYLGSGGALDSLLFMCDWAEHAYDLGSLTPGSTTQIRFRFKSDASGTDEGFYIDDVSIRAPGASGAYPGRTLTTLALLPASANPAGHDARWQLSLPAPRRVTARIYDPNGRVVKTLLAGFLGAGHHDLRWDGFTASGAIAPDGVYFLQLRAGADQAVRKLVRLNR